MTSPSVRRAGLDLLVPRLEETLGEPLTVDDSITADHPIYQPGNFKPLPSHAARIRLGDLAVWIPAPLEPALAEEGLASLYLHANQVLVMPTIRLWVQSAAKTSLEFLSLSDWLLDAFSRWTFPVSQSNRTATILDQLPQKKEAKEVLRIVALMIRYATLGSDRSFTLAGLRLPPLPMWLRPAGTTDFARQAARSLVITARLKLPESGPAEVGSAGDTSTRRARATVPTTNLRSEAYRIHPGEPNDWGLDPVHTPEGNDIRLTGRLGLGVAVRERQLVIAVSRDRQGAGSDPPCPLGPSTSRLPFAGCNDPRRLLMAANMQVQAVPLAGQPQTPLVRQDGPGLDPPGVNLRVGYLAWQGFNHEDAWVVSESAAKKLTAIEDRVLYLGIRGIEEPPQILVQPGDTVQKGQLLLRRFVAPALLCSSLDVLGKFDLTDGKAILASEPEDVAPWAGHVLGVELTTDRRALSASLLAAHYRCVYRISLRRTLPLTVGDKLANRHGHKGVVGAILADESMPRWRGCPLEALIDPVSVLNRSNWGQVKETLAGAALDDSTLSPDELGRFVVEPPADNDPWMSQPARTVAGLQFVMRMPQHACDKLSGSPLPPRSNMHRRQQRFGEMDHWALWAHNTPVADAPGSPLLQPGEPGVSAAGVPLSTAAAKLARLLATAGFLVKQDNGALQLSRLPITDDPPLDAARFAFADGILARAYDALDEIPSDAMTVLHFDPPLCDVPLAELEESDFCGERKRRKLDVVWLPLLPVGDRPTSLRPDGSEALHELTRTMRRIVRLLRKRPANPRAEDEGELRFGVQSLMEAALTQAIGLRATDVGSSKAAYLRRGVLGQRLEHSGRATASPAGKLAVPLALDEIGLPPALAWSLFGPGLPEDVAELARAVDGRQVWLKRDPVLHRWGLLPVRVRVMAGHTIRLPASLLSPLGADFDGDTVALFAELPGVSGHPAGCAPPALAWHAILGRAMFLPGKQYLHGLNLLLQDPARLAAFQQALAAAGAPAFGPGDSVQAALQIWVRAAAGSKGDGRWWAILEEHALAALGSDPSMGFGLLDVQALAALDVVRCGAAKNLYREPQDREAMARILAGESLKIYQHSAACGAAHEPRHDPIADVMVAAKASIGRFGGALRRLIFNAATPLSAQTVELAQALTEQVTQKALSVKGGKPPIYYGDYERQLRRLLRGEMWEAGDSAEMRDLLQPLDEVWQKLTAAMPGEQIPWLSWLRQPHLLPELLREAADGTLRLPLDDLRMQGWLR